jgi:hypothetical protein
MAPRNKAHLILPTRRSTFEYGPVGGGGGGRALPAPQDRRAHGNAIRNTLESAERDARTRRAQRQLVVADAIPGTYVVFESFPGIELALDSLDPRIGKTHPELRAVRTDQINGEPVEMATVFVPDGTMKYFLDRLDKYLDTADEATTASSNLVDRINAVRIATVQALWTDPLAEFPEPGDSVWWEVWLRRRDGNELDRLRTYASTVGVQVGRRALGFGSRTVVLVHASVNQLAAAIDVLDDIAEFRHPHGPAQFLANEEAATQNEFVQELVQRVTAADASAPAVCVVDTGVHHTHALLTGSLHIEDCHAADPTWPTGLDDDGHGTKMAGLALYGDLADAMKDTSPVHLRHKLESLKLLPPRGQCNDPELYGAITASGTSAVEIGAPDRRRVYSMAVTATAPEHSSAEPAELALGKPTSWSASLDALAAGRGVIDDDSGIAFLGPAETDAHRLFMVSAGNVDTYDHDHLARSDTEPAQDPAQAWNVLTVGAFTDHDSLDHAPEEYQGWSPLAPRGELSPFSRTSVAFSSKWPIKPEIILEGGNLARSPSGKEIHPLGALDLLTTRSPTVFETTGSSQLLATANATSAATAQAARMAAQIMAEYPSLWPEAVRALIVHSAEWTTAMKAQFGAKTGKRDKRTVLRRYGMGVPDLVRATRSASDALTLIAQDTITPFEKGTMREIHFHDLPWPTDVLADLGGSNVRLRVTLSYFIEPNPTRRGWNGRYSYASHGLRFDVRRPTESNDEFHKRLNKKALEEEEKRPTPAGEPGDWVFGSELQKSSGSLHTDIWTGTAADLAQRGALAVYPVGGWWKDRSSRDDDCHDSRYAFIVSIDTPGVDADVWTPVAQQIEVPATIVT